MAARCLRWLTTDRPLPASLMEAAQLYWQDSGYADLTRRYLRRQQSLPLLDQACAALFGLCRHKRERENRHFAGLLQHWQGDADGSVIPLEDVIPRLLRPLAEVSPVLLLVMDGMSVSVYHELLENLREKRWVELSRDGGRPAGLAVLPSETNPSRASLLAGKLTSGDQSFEKAAFQHQPLLLLQQCVALT